MDRFDVTALHARAKASIRVRLDDGTYSRLPDGGFTEAEARTKLYELLGQAVEINGARVSVLNHITVESWRDAQTRKGVTAESIGYDDDPRKPKHFRLEPIVEIREEPCEKIWEWPDGRLERLTASRFVAYCDPEEGDWVMSGPEFFELDAEGRPQPQMAAVALLVRLLEGVAIG